MIANIRCTLSWRMVPAFGLVAALSVPLVTTAVSLAGEAPEAAKATTAATRGAAKKPPTVADSIKDLSAKDLAARDAAMDALIGGVVSLKENDNKDLIGQLRDSLEKATDKGQVRTWYLMGYLSGTVRVSAKSDKDAGLAVLLSGLHYLEGHLGDVTVANFGPQDGFTHIVVYGPDGDGQWSFIIERTNLKAPEPAGTPRRGLTLKYDAEKKRIVEIGTWGDRAMKWAVPG